MYLCSPMNKITFSVTIHVIVYSPLTYALPVSNGNLVTGNQRSVEKQGTVVLQR